MPYKRYDCLFRLVNETDATFIFNLRTNRKLSRFLNPVKDNLNDQVNWITDYKLRESKGEEFYFISLDPDTGERQGLNRIYNFQDTAFALGSWLYRPDPDISKSILGDIITKEIAFDYLHFEICMFDVRKENLSVVRYHKGYSPEIIGGDNENLYFSLTREKFNINKTMYLKICGHGQHL